MLARKITLKHYFEGAPTLGDFELTEETLSDTLQDGEILIKGECFSVDPYMRAFGNRDRVNVGDTMVGSQIGLVLKSRNPKFAEGTKVLAYVGWRDLTVCNPDRMKGMFSMVIPLPDLMGLPDSYALGAVGMTGLTAYFGLTKLCQPKKGETLVVNSAAGAVGSLVGQIAKAKGCKVVGFTGSSEKVKWIEEDLKFDFAFNYKGNTTLMAAGAGTTNPTPRRRQAHSKVFVSQIGPSLISFNVGGEFSYTIIKNMNPLGRIAVCGAISQYNKNMNVDNKVSFDYAALIYKQIRMEGFLISRWMSEWKEGAEQLVKWIHEGKIIVRETHTKGFENMPQAFIDMLEGRTIGKAIVLA